MSKFCNNIYFMPSIQVWYTKLGEKYFFSLFFMKTESFSTRICWNWQHKVMKRKTKKRLKKQRKFSLFYHSFQHCNWILCNNFVPLALGWPVLFLFKKKTVLTHHRRLKCLVVITIITPYNCSNLTNFLN